MVAPPDLRVALSMITLVQGGMGGSETYARELTRQLNAVGLVNAVAIVPRGGNGFSQGIPELVARSVRTGASARDRLRTLLRLLVTPSAARRLSRAADVVHFPFTVPVPRPARSQATVVSLLDVQHLDLPEMFSTAERIYRRYFYDRAARRAEAVITISEFAKQRMIELLGLDPDLIHVAHLGVDVERFIPNTGSRENFILYPARAWPHKNHRRLIEAVGLLRKADPSLRLVLTGGGLDSLGALPEWVDRRGLVSVEELRDLYRRASVLAFPSLYEGFGLPPLEAMASGCPTAVSWSGSIPEVCGDAAVQFDPLDPRAIAHGIEDARRRSSELTRRGLAHVRTFTWEACRDAHLTAYRAAHSRRSRSAGL